MITKTDINEQVAIIIKHEITQFNIYNIKSPMLARVQRMLKIDDEDFKASYKALIWIY